MYSIGSKVFLILLFSCLFGLVQAQEKDSLKHIWSGEIYFDFAKSDLRSDADSLLQLVLEKSNNPQLHSIRITAHTDAIGSNKSNWTLAEARGASVKNYLSAASIADSILFVTPFGEEKPVVDNETEANRQRNRRHIRSRRLLWW